MSGNRPIRTIQPGRRTQVVRNERGGLILACGTLTAMCLYAIRLRGVLSDTLLVAFPELHAETCGSDTLLTGAIRDQAALHGVLGQIEALGLELLELRRVERPNASAT